MLCNGQRALVFGRRLANMTRPAKRLQVRHVVGVATPIAVNMIALESPGPAAHDAAPAVALEDVATDGGPAVGMKAVVVPAHAIVSTLPILPFEGEGSTVHSFRLGNHQ